MRWVKGIVITLGGLVIFVLGLGMWVTPEKACWDVHERLADAARAVGLNVLTPA